MVGRRTEVDGGGVQERIDGENQVMAVNLMKYKIEIGNLEPSKPCGRKYIKGRRSNKKYIRRAHY